MIATLILATAVAMAKPPTSTATLNVSVQVVESCRFQIEDQSLGMVCNGKPPHHIKPSKIIIQTPNDERIEADQMIVVF